MVRLLIVVTIAGFAFTVWTKGLDYAVIWVLATYAGAGIGVALMRAPSLVRGLRR